MGLKRRLKKIKKKRDSFNVFITIKDRDTVMKIVEEFRFPPLPTFLALNMGKLEDGEREKACNLMADLHRKGDRMNANY